MRERRGSGNRRIAVAMTGVVASGATPGTAVVTVGTDTSRSAPPAKTKRKQLVS